MRSLFLVAAVVVAVAIPIGLSADIMIDNYTAGTPLGQFGAGTANQTTVDVSILGGERDETITVTAQGGSEFFGVMGFGGAMDVGQGSLDQIFGGVTYDDFGPLDFTEGGTNNSFELGLISSDINAELTDVISLTVASGLNSATHFISVPANSILPVTVYVDFSNFAGVNMTMVDSLSLNFDFAGHAGRDVEVGLFSATANPVPEPGMGLLAGIGFLAFIGLRRRRR